MGIEDSTGGGVTGDDPDFTPDDFQFKPGIAWLECAGTRVDLDITTSFYQPAGNQLIPARVSGGIDRLGPALVLHPDANLPPGQTCQFHFDSSVIDKDGNNICAPDWRNFAGYMDDRCQKCLDFRANPRMPTAAEEEEGLPCSANEVRVCLETSDPNVWPMVISRILNSQRKHSFFREAHQLTARTGVALATSRVLLDFNAGVDVATVQSNVTIVPALANGLTASAVPGDDSIIQLAITAGDLVAMTSYTVTIPVTVTTADGFALNEEYTITFETAP